MSVARIPNYHGIILTGLATSWQSYYEQDKNQEMCHLLKETFKIYRSACKGIENVSKKKKKPTVLLKFWHYIKIFELSGGGNLLYY